MISSELQLKILHKYKTMFSRFNSNTKFWRSSCAELLRNYLPDRRFYLDLHPGAQCALAWASSWKCSHNVRLFQGRENAAGHRGKTHWFDEFRMAKRVIKSILFAILAKYSQESTSFDHFWLLERHKLWHVLKRYLWFIIGEKHGKSAVEQSKHTVLTHPAFSI